MAVLDQPRPLRWWDLALSGSVAGAVFGIVSGPVAMPGTMWLENDLHGTTFLGLELVGAVDRGRDLTGHVLTTDEHR